MLCFTSNTSRECGNQKYDLRYGYPIKLWQFLCCVLKLVNHWCNKFMPTPFDGPILSRAQRAPLLCCLDFKHILLIFTAAELSMLSVCVVHCTYSTQQLLQTFNYPFWGKRGMSLCLKFIASQKNTRQRLPLCSASRNGRKQLLQHISQWTEGKKTLQ